MKNRNWLPINQRGYVGLAVVIFLIAFAMVIYPLKFPSGSSSESGGSNFCREFIHDPDSPTIQAGATIGSTTPTTFRLIKQNVPINPGGYTEGHHIVKNGNTTVDGKLFEYYYPTPDNGRSYDFNTEDGVTDISFIDYGLLFLHHLNADGTVESIDGDSRKLEIIDIYQDITKPPLDRAENILKCIDIGTSAAYNPKVLVPTQNVSLDQSQLQLEWFIINQTKYLPKAWWTPECKPAIYLYPREKQLVNVRVYPKGELGFTDPPYNPGLGWTVNAYPSGKLFGLKNEPVNGNYLYYESKIWDSVIKKPETGWVVKFEDLEALFESKLPLLGLNEKEKNDFKEYWLKVLPKFEYYFVGLVNKDQRDFLEPLSVTPTPDTLIRFSFYFEMLDRPILVQEPEIVTPKRTGFTLVDWGGLMKLHPGTPFTCSQ